MTFSTAVEGLTATRANTAEGQWTTGDKVAMQVGNDVKQYTPASTGTSVTLQAASDIAPFYWQKSDETKTVSAWYCGTEYKSTLPATWAVQSDQNTNDGYQQSDFLYAPETTISFADRSSVSLTFYHQTAKVIINILNAEAATNAEQITSVVIGNNNIALSGTYAAPGTGQTAGTWSNNTGTGTITPKEITTASGYLKSYAALVIPQNVTGKFIAVTLSDGNTYYYTPASGEANLQSGQQHTYDITVKNGYLDVVTSTGGAWDGDGTSVQIFSAGQLKPGDYYYSDGTSSDGGLRAIYPDGTTQIEENISPDVTNGRTVIGIVFWTGDATASDNTLKTDHESCTHGLVVALKDAMDGTIAWQNPYTSVQTWLNSNTSGFLSVASGDGANDPLNNIQGYNNTKAIEAFNAAANSNWTPATDQSTYAKYTAQDLMIAQGIVTDKSLSFSMTHKMALVVIELPKAKYKLSTDNNYTWAADAPGTKFTDFTPYRMSDGTYRYLVNPSASSNLSASYVNTTETWSFTPSVSAGNYKVFQVDGGSTATVELTYTLQAGDFYMKDGSLAGKDASLSEAQKQACVGVVYCVDNNFIKNNSTKKTDGGYTHGLVVALKDASGSSNWSNASSAAANYNVDVLSSCSDWYLPNKDELTYIC